MPTREELTRQPAAPSREALPAPERRTLPVKPVAPAQQQQALAHRPQHQVAQRVVVDIKDDKIAFNNYTQMVEWLDEYRKTANVPAHFKTGNVNLLVQAVQLLINMGLPWISFLDKTSFVNNRLGLMSDAIAAAVRASGLLEVDELEYYDKDGKPDKKENVHFEPYACVYTAKRKGDRKEHWYRYTLKDKQTQGLGRAGGAWSTNPRDMLKHRARTRVLRDLFPDIIGGVAVPEVDGYDEKRGGQVSAELKALM